MASCWRRRGLVWLVLAERFLLLQRGHVRCRALVESIGQRLVRLMIPWARELLLHDIELGCCPWCRAHAPTSTCWSIHCQGCDGISGREPRVSTGVTFELKSKRNLVRKLGQTRSQEGSFSITVRQKIRVSLLDVHTSEIRYLPKHGNTKI